MRTEVKFRNAVNGFNKSDVMQCIEDMMTENANQKKRIKELEDQLFVAQTSLEQIKNEPDTKTMCENCDAAKIAQAQLGAAMLDAKRFSEMLMKDANDKSAQVLNKAMNDVIESTSTANDLADSLKSAKENFSTTLDSLQEELGIIILSFMEFKEDLEKKGLKFDFATDFADQAAGES